jgi:hypothetical protein
VNEESTTYWHYTMWLRNHETGPWGQTNNQEDPGTEKARIVLRG